jgi:hypothetical protein
LPLEESQPLSQPQDFPEQPLEALEGTQPTEGATNTELQSQNTTITIIRNMAT